MSLVFNDTSTFRGLVQIYEAEIGANQGDVSGNTTKLKQFTADANLALDDFIEKAIKSSGTWQWDDSNQTDYPIIKTNIVSGQRDYSFTTDQSSNLILDIYKVAILQSSSATEYVEIDPVDTQNDANLAGAFNSSTTGISTRYDKTSNGIFLDPKPNYNATNGLLVYINREGSYFTSSDTTKKPGVPGIFHKYFALRPAQDYARRNNLKNADKIQEEVLRMEQNIETYFSLRPKDERRRLTPAYQSNK